MSKRGKNQDSLSDLKRKITDQYKNLFWRSPNKCSTPFYQKEVVHQTVSETDHWPQAALKVDKLYQNALVFIKEQVRAALKAILHKGWTWGAISIKILIKGQTNKIHYTKL